jgi:hypothetical protein
VENQRIVTKGDKLMYLSLMNIPADNKVVVPWLAPQEGKTLGITSVSVLGHGDKNVSWTSDEDGFQLLIPEGVENEHALVVKIEGESLENYDEAPIQKLFDRSEELSSWWEAQPIDEIPGEYLSVTCDNNNQVWAIDADNNLIELANGEETPLGLKALDVGTSSGGIVYIGLDGSVYLHCKHYLQWIDLPSEEERVTHESTDGKQWIKLPGIRAKRCDITQTGGVWVIGQDHRVAYYNDLTWKPLDKSAEDIACGGGWLETIAVISNGQVERFEGTYWENLGGGDLKAVDISLQDKVIVTLDGEGKVSVYDRMGSTGISAGSKKFRDVSCGLKNGSETVVLALSE